MTSAAPPAAPAAPPAPPAAPPTAAEVFEGMLACARRRGVTAPAQGCVAGVCGASRQVPVQLWRHTGTGAYRYAWLPERPAWDRSKVEVVRRFNCFYSCEQGHLHHCAAGGHCNSLSRGHVVETDNGDVVCATSGRVLHTATSFDWKERKKGAYTTRRVRRPGPVVMCAAGDRRVHHNAHDYKLMEIAVQVVFDVLFSRMRKEIYVNERRAKKRALESRVMQYSKLQKRRHRFIYVAHFNKIAIAGGFFSGNTYGNVSRALDPCTILRRLAPLVTALFQHINALTEHPTFKCFASFAVAMLYTTIRGVRLHGVDVVPCLRHMRQLLPHPNTIGEFFRFKWALFTESVAAQRSFLTKNKNAIQATLRLLRDAARADAFRRDTAALAAALRDRYYDLVELTVKPL